MQEAFRSAIKSIPYESPGYIDIIQAYSVLKDPVQQMLYDAQIPELKMEKIFMEALNGSQNIVFPFLYYMDYAGNIDQQRVVEYLSKVSTCLYHLKRIQKVRIGFTNQDRDYVSQSVLGKVYYFQVYKNHTMEQIAYLVSRSIDETRWYELQSFCLYLQIDS